MELHYQKDLDLLNQETQNLVNQDLEVEKKLKHLDDKYTSEELKVDNIEMVDNPHD